MSNMKTPYRPPRHGHYRLPSGIRILPQSHPAVAVCDYPLRLVRLNTVTARLLSLCIEEHTCEQLAQETRVLCHKQRQGVGISRNTGAEAARHDLIAYLDSDCVASPGWLRELVPAFQDERVAAVGGMIRAYDRKSLLGRYEDVHSSLFMGMQPQLVHLEGPLTYLPTANMLLRRAAWQQLSGFAPMTQGEDVDFCRRLLISGASIRYLPQGVVYHDYRTTLGAFLRIRFAYASAEAHLLQRHPTERRILLLPSEQAAFAGTVIGGAWGILWRYMRSPWQDTTCRVGATLAVALGGGAGALFLTLFGAHKRLQKVRAQRVPIGFLAVFKATLRGHLAYTYLLSRHLTRYYTLPLLVVSLLIPPLLLLTCLLCGIVIGIDYWRLRPEMGLGWYALFSVLDDCAYEVGVVWGCVKHRTWKPLVPLIKKQV